MSDIFEHLTSMDLILLPSPIPIVTPLPSLDTVAADVDPEAIDLSMIGESTKLILVEQVAEEFTPTPDGANLLRAPSMNIISQSDDSNDSSLSLESNPVTLPPSYKTIDENWKIGLSYLPLQSKELASRKGAKFTLMVAGQEGTGKSTFLNTLFGCDLVHALDTNNRGTANIDVNTYKLVEDTFQLELTTVDTPGFGKNTNNQFDWAPITDYIDEQFRLYLFQSEQPERIKREDNRVHVCLYFIVPTLCGLKPLDVIAMRELSSRVNLIPVISKGDTLNKNELRQFKDMVKMTLSLQDINVCDLILDSQVSAKINSQVPFSIIGSNLYYVNEKGEMVRGRKYPWGVAEVENEEHCDFVQLRKILMSENMLDLINSTEVHYENYRRNSLHFRFVESANLGYTSNLGDLSKIDGFQELKIYNRIPLTVLEENIRNKHPSIPYYEKKIRAGLSGIVSNQELRFREWKSALVKKQDVLNRDIEHIHDKLIKLQELVSRLETGLYSSPVLSFEGAPTLSTVSSEVSSDDDYNFR